jgi:hypothetical protein
MRSKLLVRRIALALSVVLVVEYVGYFTLVPGRPSAAVRFETALPGGPWANVIGQVGLWQWLYGVLLILALYFGKTIILHRCESAALTTILFGMMLALCLPLLWVFVTTDWNNGHAELAYWLTLPVGLLGIPTIGMIVDLIRRPYVRARQYALKSFVELALIPVWLGAWIFFEFVVGFYWI